MAVKKTVSAKASARKALATARGSAKGVPSKTAKAVKSKPASKPQVVAKKPAMPAAKPIAAKPVAAKSLATRAPAAKAPVTKPAAAPLKITPAPAKVVAKKPLVEVKKVVAEVKKAMAPVKVAVKAGGTPIKLPLKAPAAAAASPAGAVGKPAGKPTASGVTQIRAVAAAMAKSPGQRISAPVTPKDIASKSAEARQQLAASKKPVNQRHGFKTSEYVVYPAHGVGRIVGIEEQEIAGMSLELFVITFEKDKMTLRVPTGKLVSVGMRKLADENVVRRAMETLKGRARIKRTMWSRRAQEYDTKINSGDLVSIAEVVRDLYRSEQQPEQSYSERQLYEQALDRMAREIAAVDRLDERGAMQRITEVLAKSARGRRAAEGADAGAVSADVKAA